MKKVLIIVGFLLVGGGLVYYFVSGGGGENFQGLMRKGISNQQVTISPKETTVPGVITNTTTTANILAINISTPEKIGEAKSSLNDAYKTFSYKLNFTTSDFQNTYLNIVPTTTDGVPLGALMYRPTCYLDFEKAFVQKEGTQCKPTNGSTVFKVEYDPSKTNHGYKIYLSIVNSYGTSLVNSSTVTVFQ